MKRLKATKVITFLLMSAILLTYKPIAAHAEWKQDSVGWRYYDGDNYYRGWKQINGNWYYFYIGGYMAHDVVIEGYYLNSYGVWSDVSTTPGGNEFDKDANGIEDFLEGASGNFIRVITPEMRSDPYRKLSSGITLEQARQAINETVKQMAKTEKDVYEIETKIDNKAKELGTSMDEILIMPLLPNAWKQDYKGWWYAEGDSYAVGWRHIDGKWYYFHANGYMAHEEAVTVKWHVTADGHWDRHDYSVRYERNPNADPYSLDFIKIITNEDGTETIEGNGYTPKQETKDNTVKTEQTTVPISHYFANYPALSKRSDLSLNNSSIGDISALKGYTNLTRIYLNTNQISDISVLKEFKGLIQLDVTNNKINDINALKNLVNLQSLSIGGNRFEDLSPVSNLTNLTDLWIGFAKVNDLSQLKPLVNLVDLNMNGNEIKDISALSGMTKLKSLYLQVNQISDISAVKNMVNLETLMLSGNNISDLSPLKNLTKLTTLEIGGNPITDVSALKGLKNLSTLYLQGIKLSDSDMQALREALPNCKIINEL